MTNKEALEKIKEERDELIIKIENLNKFLQLDEEPKITKYHYSLLCMQLAVMKVYSEILKLRITEISAAETF